MDYRFVHLCVLLVFFKVANSQVNGSPHDDLYVIDPSSTVLSSNPYGRSVKLNCIVEVPPGHVRRDVNIFWFKSSNNLRQDYCLISIVTPCSEGLGSTPQLDLSIDESFFSSPLLIKNVTAADIGCYWCFGVLCLDDICGHIVPMGVPSRAFCLQPEIFYQRPFTRTGSISLSSMSSFHGGHSLAPSTIKSLPTNTLSATTLMPHSQSSLVPQRPVILLPSSHFSVYPSHSSSSFAMTVSPMLLIKSEANLATWLYVCLALCVILAFSTCVLTAVTIYLGRHQLQLRCAPSNTVIQGSDVLVGYMKHNAAATNQVNSSNEPQCHPEWIGTYCLVQQVEEEHSFSTEQFAKKENKETVPPSSQSTSDLSKTQSNAPSSVWSNSNQVPDFHTPHSQIYRTMEKQAQERKCSKHMWVEEIGKHQSLLPEDQHLPTQNTASDYDRLFDDPNYSHAPSQRTVSTSSNMTDCTSTGNSDPKNKKKLAARRKALASNSYDKLAAKRPGSEYAYAYAHVNTNTDRDDPVGQSTLPCRAEVGAELLCLGMYEVDPELVSTLQTQKRMRMLEESDYQVPSPSSATAVDQGKSWQQQRRHGSESKLQVCHPYQSIDRSKLAPANSYASVMM